MPQGYLPVLSASQLFDRTGTGQLLESLRSKLGFPMEMFDDAVRVMLRDFAEFVQLLPASESHHHAEPGGLLTHTMEVVGLALDYRRGQILPKGALPEDIGDKAPRWTYAVFVSALLHDVGKPIADLQVTLSRGANRIEPWSPLAGSMIACGGTGYRVEFPGREARRYELHGKLAVLLLNRLVPTAIIQWLSADSDLIRDLLSYLAGDAEAEKGVLHDLVSRADAESVRRNLLSGSRVRFASARRVPLIERLMHALRSMLKEGGHLPLNRSGAAGWVYRGDIWFVSKRLADETRNYLHEVEADGDGIPADNQRLFDTWQEYGALVPNPVTGGAIWRIKVLGAGYQHALTALRFSLGVLYPDQREFPLAMAGDVEVVNAAAPSEESGKPIASEEAGEVNRVRDRPSAGRRPDSHLAGGRTAGADSSPVPVATTALGKAKAQAVEPERPEGKEAFLEDVDARLKSRSVERQETSHAREAAPFMRGAVSLPRKAQPLNHGAADVPDAVRRFMGWLQQGLADGTIVMNESGAFVHFVAEGMLLVSPRVFKEFARRFGEDGKGISPAHENAPDIGKAIQRALLRAGWHVQEENGVNVLGYQVISQQSGRAVARLSGVVISDPARFLNPVPAVNPVLTRVPTKDTAA